MLLDEWSSKELELSRAIGGSRATGARNGEGLLDRVADDPRLSRLAPATDRDGFAGDELADTLHDADDADGGDMRLSHPDDLDGLDDIDVPQDAYGEAGQPQGRWRRPDDATRPGSGGSGVALEQVVCGGHGVVLSLLVNQQPARAWVDAQAWCDWLRPRLPVQRFDHIPPELVPLLGEWALLPVQQHAQATGLRPLRFVGAEAGHCARVVAPTLTLIRQDMALSLRLLDWPTDWIEALARTMDDRRMPLMVPPIPMPLAAGWVRLTRAQVRALQPGDGIVLDQALRVEAGHAWLIAERPLAQLCFHQDGWRIECALHEDHPMQDLTDSIAKDEQLRDEDIVLTAIAELGRMSLSLDTLRGLHTGQVLDIPHASHGRVTLTVSGQPVATGTLLRVGERLVMRVE
jgi:type III secretion protein Q